MVATDMKNSLERNGYTLRVTVSSFCQRKPQIDRKVRKQATFIDLYLQFLTYVFRQDLNS